MAHIAIDARIINSSTGTYVERLLHYLQQIDTTNTYTVLIPSKDLSFWQPTNSNFTVKAADFKNYSLAEQTGFAKLLSSIHADLVHFCMPQQPLLYQGKTVTTFHDLSLLRIYNSDKNWLVYHTKQLVGKFVFRQVAKQTSHLIVPTDFVKEDIITSFGTSPKKITRTYEAADISVSNTKPYKHPFKQFILYVGQQSDYKNMRRLGEAHQQLLNMYPDLGLILVGRLNKSALSNKEYFDKNGYRNIHFTDFIPNEQRDWLYQQASAYVFPSLTEGFGLPGLEAMGYGAPVVSSNATCLPEVYGDAAHYFDPLSVQDMARAINDVISDEHLQKELQRKGYKQLKKYSWERMAQQTFEVYQKALTSSSER